MLTGLSFGNVKIQDPGWVECSRRNAAFLRRMDPDRVLAGFRRTANIPTYAVPYGGWEDNLIAGHALGHYFSALAMRIAYLRGDLDTRDDELSESISKAGKIIAGLSECQKKTVDGFLSAATIQDPDNPDIQFDVLEGRCEGSQWVPWYALHKVLQGLFDLWTIGGLEDAGPVTLSLADWVAERALSWDQDMRKKVLSVEYGGMNDTLYQLYIHTRKEEYLKAAEVFDEPDLYSDLLSFKNRMRGIHANATIPKILGYLQGALAFDMKGMTEERDKRTETAKRFWDAVILNQTYATGGIGDMEHFISDGILDGSRTQCNAESCCCYNMMKLGRLLFQVTRDPRYQEYIEKTLWNARLGSMGPSGGYTYFNPMATGYYRLYSSPIPEDNLFWCCVGTGMEDFARLPDKICYTDGEEIYITQWISSDIAVGGSIIKLRIDFGQGNLSITHEGGSDSKAVLKVKILIPSWIPEREKILQEGASYLDVSLPLGGRFDLDFEMELRLLKLPDAPPVRGFGFGPFVLCVPLGEDKWGISENAGIDVYAPAWKVVFDSSVRSDIIYGKTVRAVLDREYLILPEDLTLEGFDRDFERFIRREEDRFILTGLSDFRGKPVELPLIPYNSTGNRRYGIYWYLKKVKEQIHEI